MAKVRWKKLTASGERGVKKADAGTGAGASVGMVVCKRARAAMARVAGRKGRMRRGNWLGRVRRNGSAEGEAALMMLSQISKGSHLTCTLARGTKGGHGRTSEQAPSTHRPAIFCLSARPKHR
jgi:hypothetical protein